MGGANEIALASSFDELETLRSHYVIPTSQDRDVEYPDYAMTSQHRRRGVGNMIPN